MSVLVLIRGLPGSGKTTRAKQVCKDLGAVMFCADDYFTREDGSYEFPENEPLEVKFREVGIAHRQCIDSTDKMLSEGRSVVVHNTFTQRWEMEPYIQMSKRMKATLLVIDLYDGGVSVDELARRNLHGVPRERIQEMREGYEKDWRLGNPVPPWELQG